MAAQIPLVDYLVLDAEPHLVAQECTNCCARFFGRRNACANCFSAEFTAVPIASEGTVRAFTIVAFAAPGISTPFVASVVDCDGTQVRANLIDQPVHAELEIARHRADFVPDIAAGVDGMRFIEGVLESARRNSAWVPLSDD